jgi:hypothetical protein
MLPRATNPAHARAWGKTLFNIGHFIVMNLLRLKSCSRFTRIRRGTAGAVIGDNPAAGKKFRGEQGGFRKSEDFKGTGRPVPYANAASTAEASVFSPAATSAPR